MPLTTLCPPVLSRILLVALFSLICQPLAGQQENSGKIIRVKPNRLARQIGTAIQWQPDLATARKVAQEKQRPIFWYVPSLPNTFMDRKVEIHRYMMAGPFSWPAIIQLLNEHAVCLKTVPTKQQQQRFDLQRYQYVEPGFIVLNAAGQRQQVVDQLTTLPPQWLLRLIQQSIGAPDDRKIVTGVAKPVWEHIVDGRLDEAVQAAEQQLSDDSLPPVEYLQLQLARGAAKFYAGQHQQARQIWERASQQQPDHPLAWKLAAEAQGFGPLVRGFETLQPLPQQALAAGKQSRGSAAPVKLYDEPDVRQRGIQFLLSMQNQDGGFYDSDYDFGGTDSVKNVHVAVTALAGLALLQHQQATHPAADSTGGQEIDSTDRWQNQRIAPAIDAAIQFVATDKNLNTSDRDEIFWAYAFRLRFLLACQSWMTTQKPGDNQDQRTADYRRLIQRCIASLESVQTNRGGWYHEYPNPFVTANALLALQQAQAGGWQVDANKLKRGTENLSNERFRDGSFPYTASKKSNQHREGTDRNRIASAGRMPLCELALFRQGKSSDAKLLQAVQRSFEYHDEMAKAYKYDNHTDNYIYGGFFFWYDMRSRCEAITAIKDPDQRQKFCRQQRELIMRLPEIDGCFVDSHELGRVYGTSMALLCLDFVANTRPE